MGKGAGPGAGAPRGACLGQHPPGAPVPAMRSFPLPTARLTLGTAQFMAGNYVLEKFPHRSTRSLINGFVLGCLCGWYSEEQGLFLLSHWLPGMPIK